MINNLNNLPIQLRFRRFEFKYHLPLFLVDKVISDLLHYMKWDRFVADKQDKSYKVSSLYFDSHGLGCYHEKLSGIKRRKKLRLRTYADELEPLTEVFVEIKRKDDMVILKDRLVIDYQSHFDFLKIGQPDLSVSKISVQEKEVLKEFLWTKNYNCMLPKIMVVYKRQPLISKLDHRFRITFDSQIQTYPAKELSFSNQKTEVFPDWAVMELKYNNTVPDWFHRIVQKYQLNRSPFSKYCQSLQAWHKHYKYV
ncbi:MAG: polyphosphate polymerase domain-containing protein [bacterium]